MLMSIVALSIDTILPGLNEISTDLGVTHENQRQHMISVLFLGLAFAQLIYGPISDAFGRKNPIYFGIALFIIGCLISAFAETYLAMLWGRFLQGLGVAGPRIICTAIIRDQSKGREMARVMSLVMVMFLIVPAIAPAIGQVILNFFHWRVIFWLFVALSSITWLWLALRQAETLPPEKRTPLNFNHIARGFLEIIRHPTTAIYTVAAGLVFGAFVGFLNSSQQILQEQYALGDQFAFYFAILAIALGIASYSNSKLVMRFGMQLLCRVSLAGVCVLSMVFLLISLYTAPSLLSFMVYLVLSFLMIGLLFGNFNAIALEPHGHIAGLASSLVGSISNFVSLGLGYLVGAAYNQTVLPLVGSFALLSAVSLMLIFYYERLIAPKMASHKAANTTIN